MYVVRRLLRHAFELGRYGRAIRLTSGNALAARLARSCFDLNVPIAVATPLRSLVIEDGAVIGAIVEGSDGSRRLLAHESVWCWPAAVFPTRPDRQRRLFPHVKRGGSHLSPGGPGNTGDLLRAAADAGAALDERPVEPCGLDPVSRRCRAGTARVYFLT